MGKLILEITMSLDGFVAGPNISQEQPMGKNGHRLHDWLFSAKTAADTKLLNELMETSGAVIIGNQSYVTAINGVWESVSPFSFPALVLCNNVPKIQVKGFEFITEGVMSGL